MLAHAEQRDFSTHLADGIDDDASLPTTALVVVVPIFFYPVHLNCANYIHTKLLEGSRVMILQKTPCETRFIALKQA